MSENQSQLPDKRLEEIRERQEKDRASIRAFNAVHLPTTVLDRAVADIEYLLSLLQQPVTSERCGECGHERRCYDGERCRALILSPSVAGSGMAYCNHKCVYLATSADEGEQRHDACEKCCGHNPKFRDEQKRCWFNVNREPCGHRCGWVTFGRVKIDRETETETFERATPPAKVAEGETAGQRIAENWNSEADYAFNDLAVAVDRAISDARANAISEAVEAIWSLTGGGDVDIATGVLNQAPDGCWFTQSEIVSALQSLLDKKEGRRWPNRLTI